MTQPYVMERLPACDFHKMAGEHEDAVVDGPTKHGPWGYMCAEHFSEHGKYPGEHPENTFLRRSNPEFAQQVQGGKSFEQWKAHVNRHLDRTFGPGVVDSIGDLDYHRHYQNGQTHHDVADHVRDELEESARFWEGR